MTLLRTAILLAVTAGTASADPGRPAAPAPISATSAPLVLSPLLLDPPIPKPVPSLRLEAVRVAGELFADSWRYPEPGSWLGIEHGSWFIGAGHYRPRSSRSAALHGGSIAATILGEILLAADSPLAGLGALVTGATLDAATADADRDAEARR